MDRGKTFKRFTSDEDHFLTRMWTTLTRALYPRAKWSVCGDSLDIHVLEPKCMREIHTVYLSRDTSLEALWELIRAMWKDIERIC